MLLYNNLIKFLFEELVRFNESRMQWVIKYKFTGQIIAYLQIAILSNSSSHLIVHFSSTLITHPAMDTTTTRKYPEYVSKVEIFL